MPVTMPVTIFFCYAPNDEASLDTLKIHLSPLQWRGGFIDVWHDSDIRAGAEWERELEQHLNTAQIILLFISPDFIYSNDCYSMMEQALRRHESGEAKVIPIILRPTLLDYVPFELYEEAHTVYGDCIRLVVDDPYCHYGKGLALFRLNRYKEALVAYEEAIRLSEPKPDPQFYYGKVLVYERLVQEDYERERQACLDWNPNRENNLSALLLVSPEAFTLHNLTKHTDEIWQLVFSPDSKFLASLSKDHTIKLWDPRTGDFLYSLELPDEIWKLTFSPNGKFLASRGKDHTIRLWDPRTGDLLHDHLIGHTDDIWELVFSLDSKFLASRSQDHTVRLWDPRTGELLYPLPHTDAVWELVFSPDSEFLASRSQDHTIRLWDMHTGTEELLYPLERTDDVYQLAFSPDSKLLASRSQDRALRLWDTHTRKLLHTLEHTSDIRDFAFSPDGHYLASCSAGRRINFWNPWTGEHLRTLQESIENPWHLVFSPDGQRLANCGDNQIELWDPQSQADKPLYSLSESAGGLQSRCPVFSPDGHYLASQSKDETIKLWNSYTGDLVRVLTGHVGKISGFTFSPNGHYLASWSEDKTIKLWSMPNKNSYITVRNPC